MCQIDDHIATVKIANHIMAVLLFSFRKKIIKTN